MAVNFIAHNLKEVYGKIKEVKEYQSKSKKEISDLKGLLFIKSYIIINICINLNIFHLRR